MKRGERGLAALAVALPVFTVLWQENRGDFSVAVHALLSGPGSIHVPVADYDGDGQPDVGAGTPPAAGSAS
jgi:hypothetical protein